jgi:hypothetical protein
MFSMKSFSFAAVGICTIIFTMCSNEQKPPGAISGAPSVVWIPVDEKDWAIYKDVPNYHFARAKDYLRKGNYANASAELKRGNSFLIFQNYRLLAVAKQIKVLSDSVAAGQFKDINKLDAATANAIKIINDKYAMVPIMVKNNSAINIDNRYYMASVEIRADSVFEEEFNYHYDNAKTDMTAKDSVGAASEIRMAGSFLRLKAVYIGEKAKVELDSVGNDLNKLAADVEYGTVKDIKELDRIVKKINLIDLKKKE